MKQHCNNLYLCDILRKISKLLNLQVSKILSFFLHNFIKTYTQKKYNGIYSLDVLEHIHKKKEKDFLKNICKSLKSNGSLIIGMPTLESQKYASKVSKLGHINCKSKKELKSLLLKYFNNVYMFSMNDEVVHTGYDKMSHYIFCFS